jgi:CheY-like chemotaxis protein
MVLPVIMATGSLPTEEFTRHPWLQPAATLLKSYSAQEMLRTVKKVLREAIHTPDGSQVVLDRDMKSNRIPQPGTSAGAPRQRSAKFSHRVLIVDEDRDLRQLYAEALAGQGYQVDAAKDGVGAWKALQANCYQLLITEHAIPNLTGVELVKMLRAARMALPVVMVAGRLPTHELGRNPSLQLAATLSKPFQAEVLLDTVQNLLCATDNAPKPPGPLPAWRSQLSAEALWLHRI